MSFTKEGGSKEVEVTSNDPAGWTATSSASWLKVEGAKTYSGMEYKKISLSAEAYPSGAKRDATVTISDKSGNTRTVSISQLGDKIGTSARLMCLSQRRAVARRSR